MRRPQPSLAAVGAALILAGGATAAVAGTLQDEREVWAAVVERPVNAGAGDLGDIRAHNSPALARDPRDVRRVVVAGRVDTPRFSCAVRASADGGRTWRSARVPIPSGEEPKCYAPDVAFTSDGVAHLSYVTLRGPGNVPDAVWASRSRDGGRTFDPPVRVAGPRAFQVRIATDPRRSGRVFLTWLQAGEVGPLRFTRAGNPIVMSRSDDGGRRWRRPVRVSAPARRRVLAPTPAVGPRGELYVLFVDVGGDRLDYHGGHDGFGGPPYGGRFALVLGRSARGDGRWEESVVDDALAPVARFVPFIPPFPALAVDPRDGRLFAAFHDAREGDADVRVWVLDAGAARWRAGVRVNDTERGDGTAQLLPQLAVGDGGRLDVVYYDRRADPRDRRAEVSLQSSSDGGRTFGPRTRLSTRAFDTRIGFGSERDMPDLGSRLALSTAGDRALAVWSDTRHGTDASNKQDLVGATAVRRTVGEEGPRTARQLGLAVGAGGLAALIAALRRRRRRVA